MASRYASIVLSGLSGTIVKPAPVASGAKRNLLAPQLLQPARPCTSSMQTSRVRSGAAAFTRNAAAGTIDSRNGNATVAPAAFRNVRRGRCFPVMKCTMRLPRATLKRSPYSPYCVPTDSACFIRNASLLITPRMNADIL